MKKQRLLVLMSISAAIVLLLMAPEAALAAPDQHRGGHGGWHEDWSDDWDEGWTESEDDGGYAGSGWIDVDLSAQWLTAYEGDTPVFGTAVSTGVEGHETPEGDFEILWMLEYEDMAGSDYYLEDVPYVMYFADYLAIHGTYWHDNFGEPMSHGCVNLPIWAAAWVYDWATIGTPVSIHY